MRLGRVLGASVLLTAVVVAPVLVLRHTDTGPVLRTVRVGAMPGMVAVDEASARLFVVNTNSGCSPQTDDWAWIPGSVRHRLSCVPEPPTPQCNLAGSVTVVDTSRL
jgi:hypothetical protein